MLSAMFRRDYDSLTAQGYALTPEDVVRLNALALRVRLSSAAPCSVHLPRLVFMPRDSRWRPQIVLREPTMAHELWIEQAAKWIDTDNADNFLWLHGYALSRPASKLANVFDAKGMVKAVFRFAAKRLCRFTREQLSAAVEYALFGADWIVGEVAADEREHAARADGGNGLRETGEQSPTLGILSECRALRLPISLDDAKRLTASELEASILSAQMRDGLFNADSLKSRAVAAYVRAREEIKARLATSRAEDEPAKDRPTGGQAQ